MARRDYRVSLQWAWGGDVLYHLARMATGLDISPRRWPQRGTGSEADIEVTSTDQAGILVGLPAADERRGAGSA